MWIVCITSVRHVLTVNGYGGRQTKENEKSWCFKGWETLVIKNKKNITIFQKMVIPVYPKSAEAPNRPASCNCEDTIFTSATTRG